MSRPLYFFLITLFLNIGTGNEPFFAAQTPQQIPSGTPEVRGAWVARRLDERDTGRDMRMTMRMRLFDRQGRSRERALTLLALQGGPGRPVPGDRSLIRFTEPADIRGTAFLVWEHPEGPGGPGANDERFLYLPSLGRVRRIAASETQESFVGSDFTYEDIGGRQLDAYTYTLLDDSSMWTTPGGQAVPVYRLESRQKDRVARFPRVVSLVRKDAFVVVHAEIHNRRDEIQKTFDARRVEQAQGHWTVMDMAMADQIQRTRTELTVEQVAYDVGLKTDDFSRRELERARP
ncbi:MAG: outer membrane lipoprotein-sorting protein [Acidobacteriota bacterium]